WQILWSNPLYRALLFVIGMELALISALVVWMAVQSARQSRRGRARQRFLKAVEQDFFEAVAGAEPAALRAWMQRAAGYQSAFVRDLLVHDLLHTREKSHQTLVELYHEFGYAAEDRARLESRQFRRRVRAMRRLYVVANQEERTVLIEQAGRDHLTRVLA